MPLGMDIYHKIKDNGGRKQFAVLIDPDKYSEKNIIQTVKVADDSGVDYIFVGGSLVINDYLDVCIKQIREHFSRPVILFPGSTMQINRHADAILFLSLISGRNPDVLIGKHIIAAPYIRASSLEVIPTGYILIESGSSTMASYISHTMPIPYDKDDIAVCTAMAGEMLGLKIIYMDGGSGAKRAISPGMITRVRQNISVPLIIGGGLRTPEAAREACEAGADLIVVGNAIEDNHQMIRKISETRYLDYL